jgi:hypothetical protein
MAGARRTAVMASISFRIKTETQRESEEKGIERLLTDEGR